MNLSRITPGIATLVLVLLACSGEDLVLPTDGAPTAVAILQGNDQSGRVGEQLAQPVIVLVSDGRGRPVVDVPVALAFDEARASVEPARARTGGEGTAAFRITLGSEVGPVQGRGGIVSDEGELGIVAPVRLTALSADAAGMTLVGGDGQSGRIGSALPEPLAVLVADVFGNPIAGVPVAWSVEGGGSVSDATVETDAEGRSGVIRTLGPTAGIQLTRASAEGLAGSPVTFVHQATAGSAARLEAVSGDGQSAVVGTPLENDLVVRLLDPEGNPVAATAVAWVASGGGTLAPETVPTGPEGLAASRWTLGSRTGTQTATAVVSGVGVVTFSATAEPGTPPGLRLVTQPAASARRGVVLARQPVIQLVDPSGDELRQAGVLVTVSVAAGGGQVRGTLTRATDGQGLAVFTDLVLEGPAGQYTLAFAASGYSGVRSGAIVLSRAVTALRIDSDTPDPSAPGAAVRVAFTLTSEGGRPEGDIAVSTEDGASCRATAAAGACSLSPSRPGPQLITARFAGDAEFAPASAQEPHTVAVPPAAGPSATRSTVTVEPASLPVGGSATIGVVVRDDAGAALRGVEVRVSATGTGNDLSPDSRRTDPDGVAQFTLRSTVAETKTLTAIADGVTLEMRPAVEFTRLASTTTIESDSPDPSEAGEPIEVRVSVRGDGDTPTGSVSVTGDGGLACAAQLDRGSGRCTLTPRADGAITLRAEYPGDAAFLASSDTEAHEVRAPAERMLTLRTQPSGEAVPGVRLERQPEVQLALDGGQELRQDGVSVRVELSGPSGGSLAGETTVSTDRQGLARFRDLAVAGDEGEYTLVFSADGFRSVTSAPIRLQRQMTTTEITRDNPDPSAPGQTIEVRFRVKADKVAATGSVTVSVAGGATSCSGTLDRKGEGSCRLAPAGSGALTLVARYPGSERFAPSTDEESHQVR